MKCDVDTTDKMDVRGASGAKRTIRVRLFSRWYLLYLIP